MSNDELRALLLEAGEAIVRCISGGEEYEGNPEDVAERLFDVADSLVSNTEPRILPQPVFS